MTNLLALRNVILFSVSASKGVSIDYPSIALHAIGSQDGQAAVYLQLDLHDKELTNDDDDIQTLTLHLTPQDEPLAEDSAPTNGHSESAETTNGASVTNNSAAKALFEALSACADLNPDPMDEDDEDGEGVEMPEPGAGGWITSENMHEFMDENGNWTGPEIPVLGAGAGQVRTRDEAAGEQEGVGDEDEETKWRRTG
jgi:nucleotide-sensitive chloride channel 1A